MIKYFVMTLLLTFVSGNTLAKEYTKIDFEKLMTSYLSALVQKDEDALSKVTSERFLKKFKESGQLKQVFKAQKNSTVGKFDLTFKKAIVDKNLYLVNIKNPEEKDYNEYWYFVKESKGKLILDEMHNLK